MGWMCGRMCGRMRGGIRQHDREVKYNTGRDHLHLHLLEHPRFDRSLDRYSWKLWMSTIMQILRSKKRNITMKEKAPYILHTLRNLLAGLDSRPYIHGFFDTFGHLSLTILALCGR